MKEEKLLERILSGDQAAFTELVERYWDTVFRSTFSILGNTQEAEEITSDVFFKVHTHLSQLKEKTFFSSWLKKISFNMAIDRLRKKVGLSCISLDEVDPSDIASPPADEELLRREIVDEILLALNELSDEESDILSEHLLEGKEYSKLSNEYGLSYHAVVMRIRRAKEKVKKKVLKRLGGIIILPWKEIAKILGGATVKLTTKIAITTTALVMLAGVGVFLTHKEEKTAAKSDVKVERQFKERAPKKVSVSKPKPKEEQKVEQYSEEEIEEALAWLDSLEENDDGKDSTEPESNKVLTETSEKDEEFGSVKNDKYEDEDIQTKVDAIVQEVYEKAEEYRSLSKDFVLLGKIPQTPEVVARRQRARERLDVLKGIGSAGAVEGIVESFGKYYKLTKDTTPFEPGGLFNTLGVGRVSIEADPDGRYGISYWPRSYSSADFR